MTLRFMKFSAWIEIDDETLEMCEIEEDEEEKEISCWIEGKVEQKFKIFVKSFQQDKDSSCEVFIDGAHVTDIPLESLEEEYVEGLCVNPRKLREFVFARPSVTSDPEYLFYNPCNSGLGEIIIDFYVGELKWNPLPKNPARLRQINAEVSEIHRLKIDPIHVRNWKSGLRKVMLSEDLKTIEEGEYMWYLRQTKGERRQLPVRFRFKYRTREFLERNRIMEKPSRPRKRKTFLAPISDRDRVRLRDSEGTESIRTYPVRCSSSSTGTERDELRLLKEIKRDLRNERLEMLRRQIEFDTRLNALLQRMKARSGSLTDSRRTKSSTASSLPFTPDFTISEDGTIDLT